MADVPLRRRSSFLAAFLFALSPVAGHAQAWIKPGDETLLVNLGGLSAQIDTKARLDGSLQGTPIDLEGNGGLSDKTSSFFAGATLRMAQRHRVDALYNAYKRSGSHVVEKDYVINDVLIPAGTTLSAESKSQLFYVGYRYSFVKTPDMELGAGLGLYGGNVRLKFDATTPKFSYDEGTTVPLPVVNLTGDLYLTDRSILRGNVGGLKVKISGVEGSVIVAGVSGEYLLTNNFGLGLGLDYFDLEVDGSKSGFKGNFQLKSSKATLYLTGRF